MKKITIAFISLLAIVMASCEPNKKFNSYGFEGEYEMRTKYEWKTNGESVQSYRDMISPVKVFVENGHLYIRTNSFGMPNYGDYDTEEVVFTYDPPVEQYSDNTSIEGNGEGIENIVTDTHAVIFIRDGYFYVERSGKTIKSLPIEALSVQQEKILFKKSDSFDIPLTDANGRIILMSRNHFEYGQAVLRNDSIFWDIELYSDMGESSSSSYEISNFRITYHNVLVRK